jgi:putative glutamine amidotransferase
MKNGMQGLVVPGGIDVDPKLYGESHIPELEEFDTAFDGFEMALVKDAARRRLPVLGICRGMQLINVCFGGSLYQDIPTQYGVRGSIVHRGGVKGKTTPSVHRISIESGSLLYTLLGVTSVEVNSSHHQSVKARAKGFRITARAADGVAEAMETTGPGLFLCVQFHPERLRASDPRFDRLFEWLVQKASEVPISPEEASPLPDR